MKSPLPNLPPALGPAAPSQPPAAPSVPAAAGVVAPATLDFALLRGALEEIPFGVATTRGAALLYANEALSRIFGAPSLEQRQVSDLFTPSVYADIARALEETRVFDDRVKSRGFDGRELDLEVHVEQYSSEAQGTGGFLVVRDVSAEASALGRLVEQLAGALFRVRVADAAIELVSPGIARITGIDAARCVKSPVLLTTLLSGEERERVAFLYRRMVKGDLPTANAQVSLRRPDGVTRVVQIRANARRDTGGFVRHIDGVIIDAARDPETAPAEGPHRPEPAFFERDATARATMDLTHDVVSIEPGLLKRIHNVVLSNPTAHHHYDPFCGMAIDILQLRRFLNSSNPSFKLARFRVKYFCDFSCKRCDFRSTCAVRPQKFERLKVSSILNRDFLVVNEHREVVFLSDDAEPSGRGARPGDGTCRAHGA